jgi:hypothetical protein
MGAADADLFRRRLYVADDLRPALLPVPAGRPPKVLWSFLPGGRDAVPVYLVTPEVMLLCGRWWRAVDRRWREGKITAEKMAEELRRHDVIMDYAESVWPELSTAGLDPGLQVVLPDVPAPPRDLFRWEGEDRV